MVIIKIDTYHFLNLIIKKNILLYEIFVSKSKYYYNTTLVVSLDLRAQFNGM